MTMSAGHHAGSIRGDCGCQAPGGSHYSNHGCWLPQRVPLLVTMGVGYCTGPIRSDHGCRALRSIPLQVIVGVGHLESPIMVTVGIGPGKVLLEWNVEVGHCH